MIYSYFCSGLLLATLYISSAHSFPLIKSIQADSPITP